MYPTGKPRVKLVRFKSKALGSFLVYCSYCAVVAITLFPVLWVLSSSLKTLPEIYRYPPTWLPETPQFVNYLKVFTLTSLSRYFINSILVSLFTTAGVVLVAMLAGYGFSRFLFKGKQALMLILIGTQMIPGVTNSITVYLIIRELGLLDTLPALMLIYAAVNIPLSVWLLKTYFDTVPLSLDEAAAMDGCSRLRILFSIIVPVSLPGLAATALFSFIACWNEFYLALVLCSSVRSSTMPIGLFMFQSSYDIKWNLLGAASIVAMLPVIVLFIAFQEQFVAGLTKGAVKE